MVETVIVQVPTIPVNNVSIGYSSAMMSTTSAVSTHVAPTDAVGLAQHIAQCQKDLAALSQKQGGPSAAPPAAGSTMKFCHKYGYQKGHVGTDCEIFMKALLSTRLNTYPPRTI